MIWAREKRIVQVAAAIGIVFLLTSSAIRAEDEKNPLREELLKLNSVTGDDAIRDKLRALIKDKEKAKKMVVEAGKMFKESKGKENPFNFNGSLLVARLAHLNKQYDVAEPFYQHLAETATKLNSGEKIVTAYEGLIGLYWDKKQYSEVSKICQEFLDLTGPDEVERAQGQILNRLALAKAKEEKFDDAHRLADLLIEAAADDAWFFLRTKGIIYREEGKLDAAIEAFEKSFDKIEAHKKLEQSVKDELKDDTRYALTGLHVDNKEIDKAAKQLQTLIKRHPDNPTYKNDLGFIWCDNDKNLEESEKLIKEAIELDTKQKEKLKKEGKIDEVKPNAAYLDSLGWVYFKQKKYKEALEPLKQAAADEEDGNHLEIWDHLADTYMALGMKKEAIETWEKGLKFDDISKRDVERRRKVSEKLRKARAEMD